MVTMHDPTAHALGVWLKDHTQQATPLLDQLVGMYEKKRTAPPPQKDSFGRTIAIEYRWEGCLVG